MKTRSQKDLSMAANLVEQVAKEEEMVRDIYGGLCHGFPVMVRTCGLCQAIMFSADKMTPAGDEIKPKHKAHKFLLEHVAKILKLNGVDDLLKKIREEDIEAYMLYTRRILAAWIYFKRFAVSILDVPDARLPEEIIHD